MTRTAALLAAVAMMPSIPAASAEEAAPKPWSDAAEVSIVTTSGNAENTNLSIGNKFVYKWGEATDLTIDAGALRTETTSFLYDVDPDDTSRAVVVGKTRTVTSERFYADGKYRRTIRDGFLWYVGAGWERNEFAGIDRRFYGSGGLGYRIFKDERHSLAFELGATYTDETYTDADPKGRSQADYAGARGFLGYERKLSKTSRFSSQIEVLESLDNTSDLRANWLSSVTASLTSRLALKVSYNVLYDAEPAFRKVPVPVSSNPAGSASYELDEIDTILSVSLVVNF